MEALLFWLRPFHRRALVLRSAHPHARIDAKVSFHTIVQ
jgi:hypothetical protein